MRLKLIVKVVLALTLILGISAYADEYRAMEKIEAYSTSPSSNGAAKVIHTYEMGESVILKYETCSSYICSVVIPSGEEAHVYEFMITDRTDFETAVAEYKTTNFETWERTDFSVWYAIKDKPYKIDACATKLALEVDFNENLDWPGYCNKVQQTYQVKNRVKELKALLKMMSPSDDQLEKMQEGKVWMGGYPEHAILAWGQPKEITKTRLGTVKREKWEYESGSFIFFTNGVITNIRN